MHRICGDRVRSGIIVEKYFLYNRIIAVGWVYLSTILFIKREFRSVLIIICPLVVKVSRPRKARPAYTIMDGRDGTLMKARRLWPGGERAQNAIILSLWWQ